MRCTVHVRAACDACCVLCATGSTHRKQTAGDWPRETQSTAPSLPHARTSPGWSTELTRIQNPAVIEAPGPFLHTDTDIRVYRVKETDRTRKQATGRQAHTDRQTDRKRAQRRLRLMWGPMARLETMQTRSVPVSCASDGSQSDLTRACMRALLAMRCTSLDAGDRHPPR